MSSTNTFSRPRSTASRIAAAPSACRVASFLRSRSPAGRPGRACAEYWPGPWDGTVAGDGTDPGSLSAAAVDMCAEYKILRDTQICLLRTYDIHPGHEGSYVAASSTQDGTSGPPCRWTRPARVPAWLVLAVRGAILGYLSQALGHPCEHPRDLRLPRRHVVPAPRGERERHIRLPKPKLLPEQLGVSHVQLVVCPRAQPEAGNDRSRGQLLDLVQRGVVPLQHSAAAERAHQPDRVGQLVLERAEVAAEYPGKPVVVPELQGHVGGAEAALGVSGHAPSRAGRLHPDDMRDPVGQVLGQVGQVLRAAHLVEALQRDILATVRVGHDQHDGLSEVLAHEVVEGHRHAQIGR